MNSRFDKIDHEIHDMLCGGAHLNHIYNRSLVLGVQIMITVYV